MARKPAKAARPKTVRKPGHQEDTAKPFSKPKLLRQPPRMTAAQLLGSVWPGDKERSDDIAVKQIKRITGPKALPGYIVYRVATFNKDNKHIHRVTLLFEGRVAPNAKLIVDSDTFRHVFYYEYALARRGNAFIYRSNGDPALKTNPRNKPGIDKHTYTALRYILRAKRAGALKD